jgi:hypothetical protein
MHLMAQLHPAVSLQSVCVMAPQLSPPPEQRSSGGPSTKIKKHAAPQATPNPTNSVTHRRFVTKRHGTKGGIAGKSYV